MHTHTHKYAHKTKSNKFWLRNGFDAKQAKIVVDERRSNPFSNLTAAALHRVTDLIIYSKVCVCVFTYTTKQKKKVMRV